MARLCLSKGRANKAVVVGNDYPALLRARRRREKWTKEDRRLYQRRRWRGEKSELFETEQQAALRFLEIARCKRRRGYRPAGDR